MRHLHYAMGRQEEVIVERVKVLREVLEGVARENPITLTFMAVGFVITWIIILVTAVFA